MRRARMIMFWSVLLTLTVFAPAYAGVFQSMGILRGSKIKLMANGVGKVDAFCLEKSKDIPRYSTEFKYSTGKVKVTYHNGTTKTCKLAELSNNREISIFGANSYQELTIKARNKDISQIEFLTHAMTTEDTSIAKSQLDSFERSADRAERLKKLDSKVDLQKDVFWSHKNITLDVEKTQFGTVYKKKDLNVENTAHMNFFNLEGGGALDLFKDTNDQYVFFDTGHVEKDVQQALSVIDAKYPEVKRGSVVVLTHLDADHKNGLIKMLESGYEVDQVIFRDAKNVKAVATKQAMFELKLKNYGLVESSLGNFKIFRSGRGDSAVVSSLETAKFKDIDFPLGDKFQYNEISFGGNASVKSYQYLTPYTPNQTSLILRCEFNGLSYLNMGDADAKVITELISQVKREKAFREKHQKLYRHNVVDIFKNRKNSIEQVWLKSYRQQAIWNAIERIKTEYGSDVSYYFINTKLPQYYEVEIERLGQILSPDLVEEVERSIGRIEQEVAKRLEKESNKVKLVEEKILNIEANVLQWPHHYAVPNVKDEPAYFDLIKESNPNQIVVTVPPKGAKQDPQKIKSFFQKFKRQNPEYDFDLIFLNREGNIRHESLRELILFDDYVDLAA